MEEELGQEVKRQEEDNNQEQVRMTMTMDEMERHCEALSQCDGVNKLYDYLHTARSVLSAARSARLCESCRSRN